MMKRLALALGFLGTVALTSSCDPCSIACLLCLSSQGGGQATLQPGTAGLSSQANAVAEHVVAQPKPGAQSF